MKKNYVTALLNKFPGIASGRKNFDFFKRRIEKSIELTKIYVSKKTNKNLK